MKKTTTKKPTVVMSCDPGKDDYAWAFVEVSTGRVIDTGMIKRTLDDLTFLSFVQQWRHHIIEIRKILKRQDVEISALCVERLTPRPGMGSGATAEYVNLMIGALYIQAKLKGIKLIVPVMPSTWKGWLGSLISGVKNDRKLESSPIAFGFPHVLKNERKSDNFAIKEHQFDAIGIGLWCIACGLEPRNHHQKQDLLLFNCKASLKALWKARS